MIRNLFFSSSKDRDYAFVYLVLCKSSQLCAVLPILELIQTMERQHYVFRSFRPRLLYFLVYKTADPNFWKMGKKIKSENRLFFKYFIPDRTAKWAKWEKNDPVWVRLRIKSSKYNQRLVHIYYRDRDIFQCDTVCTSPFMGTSQNLFNYRQ